MSVSSITHNLIFIRIMVNAKPIAIMEAAANLAFETRPKPKLPLMNALILIMVVMTVLSTVDVQRDSAVPYANVSMRNVDI
jgi:hypothetical protein